MSNLACCCGHPACAYLQRNQQAISGLEKDVETAAKLGQALLSRHESYMQDSELERGRLTSDIEKIESEKKSLEYENQRVVAENQELQSQLEDLNNDIADSDARFKSLTASLVSAQYEIRRLNALAARASYLEAQLQSLESDQAQLRRDLEVSQEDGRSHLSRWRQAECKVRDLSDQLERIEREATEEREKHVELLGRIERRRIVEKELETAAGRLKGAAAATSLARNKAGTNVVSHFVRDLLLDNSNLQAGIDELRAMLRASNEEVENLREQVLFHQPCSGLLEDYSPGIRLNEELDRTRPGSISQEVHVHHHYHNISSKMNSRRDKAVLPRRPKKRVPPSLLTPPHRGRPIRPSLSQLSNHSTPSTGFDDNSPSSLSAVPISTNRWSVQSSSTAPTTIISSMPSSPQSWRRNSSIFDRIEEGFDSSRPTSPESLAYSSPILGKSHHRDASDASYGWRSHTPALPITDTNTRPHKNLPVSRAMDNTIVEVSTLAALSKCRTLDKSSKILTSSPRLPDLDENHFDTSLNSLQERPDFGCQSLPPLRRIASSDSVCSLSGMDIHTVRKRPSIATFTPSSGNSMQTIAIVSSAQATWANAFVSTKSSQALLSNLNRAGNPPEGSGLSRWVKGKLAIAPTLSTGSLRARAAVGEEARLPGINQKGFIAGLRPPEQAPSAVIAERVNEDLLKDSLGV